MSEPVGFRSVSLLPQTYEKLRELRKELERRGLGIVPVELRPPDMDPSLSNSYLVEGMILAYRAMLPEEEMEL